MSVVKHKAFLNNNKKQINVRPIFVLRITTINKNYSVYQKYVIFSNMSPWIHRVECRLPSLGSKRQM